LAKTQTSILGLDLLLKASAALLFSPAALVITIPTESEEIRTLTK
jgi:hypothetical protein